MSHFWKIRENICSKVLSLKIWPNKEELVKLIHEDPMFNEKEYSYENNVLKIALSVIRNLQDHFYDKKHANSTEKEIVEDLSKVTDNFRIIEESLSCDMKYDQVPHRMKLTFHRRMCGLVENIYNENRHCLSFDELEKVVPFFHDSPRWNRKKIMLMYLKRMRALKYRGEEFDYNLVILESEVEEMEKQQNEETKK